MPKDTSRHPIFQVMFGVQGFGSKAINASVKTKVGDVIDNDTIDELGESLAEILEGYAGENKYKVAKFDICTFIDDSAEILKGSFNYAISLYTEETILRFVKTYQEILNQLGLLVQERKRGNELRLDQLMYLDEQQYNLLINEWNQTDKDYPRDKTIQQLFEEQVLKTPDSIALVYEGNSVSYRDLNARANQLADYLINQYKIRPDDLVALCLDRSEYMLIGILGVLKAGAAYVPMDPNYPDERIKYILEDTQTRLVLTNEVHKARLEALREEGQVSGDGQKRSKNVIEEILALDSELAQEQLLLRSQDNPKTEATSINLAYVIYTSGTTGNPKGVMQLHGNVMRLFTATNDWYGFNNKDVWTLFHSYVFDFTIWEIFGSLIYGGKLILASHATTRDIQMHMW